MYKNNWIKNIVAALAFVGISAIILYIFITKFPNGTIDSSVTAGDILVFIGTIFAAVVAIFGVYLTIDHTHKNYKEDARNRVLPFIAISLIKNKISNPLLGAEKEYDDNNLGYYEYKPTEFNFIIKNGIVTAKTELSDFQKECLDNGFSRKIKCDEVGESYIFDIVCTVYELKNVGNGAAINFQLGVNNKTTDDKDKRYITVNPLMVGETILVRLYAEEFSMNDLNYGEYCFEMKYTDIYGKEKYAQVHDFSYSKSENNKINHRFVHTQIQTRK